MCGCGFLLFMACKRLCLWHIVLIVFLFMVNENIGIIHVFSCINICRVPRKLFEHEAARPNVQTFPRYPANVNALKQTNLIVILAFYMIS